MLIRGSRPEGTKLDFPELIESELSQRLLVGGQAVSINIFRLKQEPCWILELVGSNGISVSWDEPFQTEADALEIALQVLEEDGSSLFGRDVTGDNVIPFPRNKPQ